MTEIASKIESIRNMKEDLKTIKIDSQKNNKKMFEDLAEFRNRMRNGMPKNGNIYRSESNVKEKENRKIVRNQNRLPLGSDFDVDRSSQCNDSNQMNSILNEIENVQKKSKEMLIKLENYDESDPSTSLSNMHIPNQHIKENYTSSTNTLDSGSNFDEVNIIFSKQLPNSANVSNSQETNNQTRKILSTSDNVTYNPADENDVFTNAKIDKLTKKLKEIQTQNDELRNVNENIQNLLIKLNDLKYVDAEADDTIETIKKESQMSDLTYLRQLNSETVLKNEDYGKFIRSVQITNKRHQGKMLTKIKAVKLIIKRIRDCSNMEQEHKYKVRVRQAEQSITLKAHHNKLQ